MTEYEALVSPNSANVLISCYMPMLCLMPSAGAQSWLIGAGGNANDISPWNSVTFFHDRRIRCFQQAEASLEGSPGPATWTSYCYFGSSDPSRSVESSNDGLVESDNNNCHSKALSSGSFPPTRCGEDWVVGDCYNQLHHGLSVLEESLYR